jgi:hypothetical protein
MDEFGNLSASNALQPSSSSRDLVVVEDRAEAKPAAEQQPATAHRPSLSRFHFAAAAALAVVLAVAGALFAEDRQQAKAFAEQASENDSLVHTIKSLKDRLDSTMSNAGLTDLRQSVGEIRSNLVSSREVSGALAQLSQRVDKLDHEASAKVDKLTERFDHEASALATGLSTRIDKLEQKIAAPLPAPSPVAQAKQPLARPKFDNVSMDKTSSIERSKPLLRGFVVLDARDDVALVGGRYGEREVRQGDFLPGAGRVERIELGGNGWVVTTSGGLIASADFRRY